MGKAKQLKGKVCQTGKKYPAMWKPWTSQQKGQKQRETDIYTLGAII